LHCVRSPILTVTLNLATVSVDPRRDNIVLLRRTIGAVVLTAGWTAIGCNPARPAAASTPSGSGDLRDPATFAGIRDPSDRSRALFLEASRVLLHPRVRDIPVKVERIA